MKVYTAGTDLAEGLVAGRSIDSYLPLGISVLVIVHEEVIETDQHIAHRIPVQVRAVGVGAAACYRRGDIMKIVQVQMTDSCTQLQIAAPAVDLHTAELGILRTVASLLAYYHIRGSGRQWRTIP